MPHKDIRIPSALNDLLMSTPALLKHNYTGTCIQHPHKSNRGWSHIFQLHLLKQFQCLLPLPTFHTSQYRGVPSDHISRWHLVEHSPSILHAPTFCININQATPHKDIRLKSLWMICSWTWLSSSSAPEWAHALITWRKVNLLEFPFYCICWKSCIAFSVCPPFTYFVSFLFHAKMCCAIVLCLVPLHPSLLPPSRVSPVLEPKCFLCLLMFEMRASSTCL